MNYHLILNIGTNIINWHTNQWNIKQKKNTKVTLSLSTRDPTVCSRISELMNIPLRFDQTSIFCEHRLLLVCVKRLNWTWVCWAYNRYILKILTVDATFVTHFPSVTKFFNAQNCLTKGKLAVSFKGNSNFSWADRYIRKLSLKYTSYKS